MKSLKLFLTVLALSALKCFCQNCENEKFFKVMILGDAEVRFITDLERNAHEWNITTERAVRKLESFYLFKVPECKIDNVKNLMAEHHIYYYETFDPYQNESEVEPEKSMRKLEGFFDPNIIDYRYLSHAEMNEYIDEIAIIAQRNNPNILITVKVEGQSFEGRDIKSISFQYKNKTNNPVILIDAGIHAREWTASAMGINLLRQLANEAELDKNGIIYSATFIIVPMVNPDGYEFSKNGHKMWRKTRKPVDDNCFGVDGNRNYDVFWNNGDRERLQCQEVYRGETPFSESETRIVRDLMFKVKDQCKMYISIHTYGNTILYPYGYTTKKHPRIRQLHTVAEAGANAIMMTTGSKFVPDQSGSNLYVAAGGSDDYALEVVGIPYAYTFELGAENFGFAVPLNQLKPTLLEGWTVIKAMSIQVLKM